MSWILSQRKLIFAKLLLICSLSTAAEHSYRIGGVMGFGGSGISKSVSVTVNDQTVDGVAVSRSNGPGVYGFFIEYPFDSYTSLSLERFQGFSLSPYADGVEFTGVSYKWYYMQPLPSMVKSENSTTLMIKQFVPFVAGAVGIAKGNIDRRTDLVTSVDATGIYFGGHIGADYQFAPNWILRPDIIFGTTMPSADKEQAMLSLFGLTAGLVYIF